MISQQHLDEWIKGSGVSEEITLLNVETLDDPSDIDHRLNRNNDRRWKHWEHGAGWWVSGVDPQTGEKTLLGGQFKPDTPVPTNSVKKDGTPKTQKYISASEISAEPLFLDTGDPDYWKKAQDDVTAKITTLEGAKKAGALLTHGHVAISISGVTNGQKLGRLKDKLKAYCQTGRNFYLGFDGDWRTNPDVFRALTKLGVSLAAEGCKVWVLWWDEQYKGIDDFIVAGGDIEALYRDAFTFEEWQQQYKHLLNPKPTEKDKPKTEIFSKLDEVDPLDHVLHTTFDNHCFTRLFGGENGDWITLDQAFYKYNERLGYWRRVEDSAVHKLIIQQSRKAYTLKTGKDRNGESYEFPVYNFAKDGQVRSAFSFCRAALAKTFINTVNQEDEQTSKHLRAFRNGVVDLKTGELLPHRRDYYLTTAIAADYTPDCACPEVFRQFIEDAYGEDMLEVVRMATSMLLDPYAPAHHFIHLIGQSGSGKGTLLRLWQEMHGLEHCSSTASFAEIATPEGRHQNLTGVSLFAIPDIGGYVSGQGLKVFYELVDDGAMSGRALFSPNAYTKKWGCRFVIASVEHLRLENSNDGWDRRCIPLPTKPRVKPADRTLETRLSEVKGEIISWALAMNRDRRNWLLENLHTIERIELAKADAAVNGDPVRLFVDLCLRPNPAPDAEPLRSYNLHSYYEAFCSAHGYQRMGLTTFANHLKSIIADHYVAQKRAKRSQDPDRPMVPPHWKNIKVLDGCFVNLSSVEPQSSFTTFKADGDEVFKCNKSACFEGGLVAFSLYAKKMLTAFDLAEKEASQYSDVAMNTEKNSGIAVGIETPSPVDNPSKPPDIQGFQRFGIEGIEGISTILPIENFQGNLTESGAIDISSPGNAMNQENGVNAQQILERPDTSGIPANPSIPYSQEPLTDAGFVRNTDDLPASIPNPKMAIPSIPGGINRNTGYVEERNIELSLAQRYEAVKQAAIAAGRWEDFRNNCEPDNEDAIFTAELWAKGGFK